MALAHRLETAIAERFNGSIRAFQQALQERGARGSAYASVHSYVKGEAIPSLEFVETAADVLGVRPEWLGFGRGEPTEEQEENRTRQTQAHEHLVERKLIVLAYSGLESEDQKKHANKMRAIRRFALKCGDGPLGTGLWEEDEYIARVLQEALRFLIHVEEFFQREDLPEDTFLRRSEAHGWNVMWQDAVLDLYARRVKGLGVRSGSEWDVHEHPF